MRNVYNVKTQTESIFGFVWSASQSLNNNETHCNATICCPFNCLLGAGEEIQEPVTVNTLFIVPKAKPTQDSTKDFTPKVEMSTPRDAPKDTKKRVRIEVCCDVSLEWNLGSHHEEKKAMMRKN